MEEYWIRWLCAAAAYIIGFVAGYIFSYSVGSLMLYALTKRNTETDERET